MTKEEFAELIETFSEDFCAKFLKIKDKLGNIIPLTFNPIQKRLYALYLQRLESKKPLRFIILKARQEGVSTFYEALLFFRTITNFNRKNLIVGNETKSSDNLFQMCKRFYNNLDPAMRPVLSASNEKKLGFDKLSSEIAIASAESGESLQRSDTIQDLHCTEVAFWRDAKQSLVGLLNTVGDSPDKLVAIESTAFGVGGKFHDLWQDAKDGLNDFLPIFVGWFELPEYSKSFLSEKERIAFFDSLTDEEKALKKTYKLALEQLNWRRWAIENLCGGDQQLFKQEYPANDVEAFLTTGNPVFDADYCNERINDLHDVQPYKIGNLEYTDEKHTAVVFVESKHGNIKLFYEPTLVEGDWGRFVAGCDVAEGLEQGDRSAIRVFDRKMKSVVLAWTGHTHPDLLAEEQYKISLFLAEDIYFCTERNNHGLTTLVRSHDLGLRNYYQADFQKGYQEQKEQIGFKTTVASKPQLINVLNAAIRDKLFSDNDVDFWKEAATFVRNEHGQMQAQGKDKDPGTKCYDDRVIAEGLMWVCHQWLSPYTPFREKQELIRTLDEYMQKVVFAKIKNKIKNPVKSYHSM